MPKYYCPYCPDIKGCIHDNKYLLDESESDFELFNIKSSIKRKNSDDNDNDNDNDNLIIDNSIKDITYRFKKIKVTKKISYKRKPDEIIDITYNKKIKVIS